MTKSRRTIALALIAALLGAALMTPGMVAAQEPAQEAAPAAPEIQMAILLDTSNSMDGLINQTRTQIWKIVNQFAIAKQDGREPNLQVALYEYGNSRLPAAEGYLRMVTPLTDDLDRLSEALFGLKTNGGQEYCGQVIDTAIRELQWSKSDKALKCIFIAGNEPFTQGPINFREACQAAIDRGVTVSTIYCGPQAVGVNTKWKEGSQLADGSFMSIDQNQTVVDIKTPQDAKLVELSKRINTTYVAYGNAKKREQFAQNQVAQDANAATSGQNAAANRALFKASGLYKNYTWDLVDAHCQGKIKIEDLKDEDLPKELRKLDLKGRIAYIEAKSKERKAIQAEVKQVNVVREKFLVEARKKLAADSGNSIDAAIVKSVRDQAAKKNFRFEKP